mmetsp:Transcript_31931/g.38867  ORF Transcript_31931/g.38867 Transcript_31931/m.38867 type:complete len:81 (+) Transcript_31931:283-525(+)
MLGKVRSSHSTCLKVFLMTNKIIFEVDFSFSCRHCHFSSMWWTRQRNDALKCLFFISLLDDRKGLKGKYFNTIHTTVSNQ